MKALAELGMSEEEYRAIQVAVYKTAWASHVEKDAGQMPAEAVSQSMAEASKEMEGAVRSGLEAAQKQGVPGSGKVSDEDVRRAKEEMLELGRQADRLLQVPRANLELFRKYETEIDKYAMHGLALIGL
jgi:hypothetical protein